MVTMAQVEGFLEQRKLALVGASRSGKKFGNVALRELRGQGYDVVPVHPDAGEIDGVRCVRSISELPGDVDACLLVVPPAASLVLAAEAAERGIRHLWLQQGAESPEAIRACEQAGVSVVHGHCILMFARPTAFFHRAHRWLWGVLGRLPPRAEA